MPRGNLTTLAVAALILALTRVPAGAADRFTDHGDGTVTDHEMSLVWAKADNQGDIGWHDAERWVRFTFPYTVGSPHGDWRLPTPEELASLFRRDESDAAGYESECGHWVRILPPFELTCGWVWTSRVSAIQAYAFSFSRGAAFADRMAHIRGYRALAVRSLPRL